MTDNSQEKLLDVIVPAYNEEENLEDAIGKICGALDNFCTDYGIIIVDDGSTDATGRIADILGAANDKINVVHHNVNIGPGQAITTGFLESRAKYITYLPADGQFDPTELEKLFRLMDKHDIVVSFRSNRHDYSLYRQINSIVYILLNRFLFGLKLKDINWVHMYRRAIFKDITVNSTGVFMPGEILVRAIRKGYRVEEVITTYYPRLKGKAKGGTPRAVFKALREMFSLWWQINRGKI